jgi:hypothetical protein
MVLKHRGLVIGLVAISGLVAGCGSSGSAPAAPIPTPTTAPTATTAPTPTPNLLATAAQQYLALATTLNAQETTLGNGACKSFTTTVQWHACYSQSLPLDHKWLNGLYMITFPSSMMSDVNAMISAETKVLSFEASLADSPNPSADTSDYNGDNTATSDAQAAAGVVRHDLGLPPVPVS